MLPAAVVRLVGQSDAQRTVNVDDPGDLHRYWKPDEVGQTRPVFGKAHVKSDRLWVEDGEPCRQPKATAATRRPEGQLCRGNQLAASCGQVSQLGVRVVLDLDGRVRDDQRQAR